MCFRPLCWQDPLQLSKTLPKLQILTYSNHGYGLSQRLAWPTDIFRQCILTTLMLARPLTTVQTTDLFKLRVRTKWNARLADRQLSSMHFDNPYADKTPYNCPKHELFQPRVRIKWKARLAETQLSSMHFDKTLFWQTTRQVNMTTDFNNGTVHFTSVH